MLNEMALPISVGAERVLHS